MYIRLRQSCVIKLIDKVDDRHKLVAMRTEQWFVHKDKGGGTMILRWSLVRPDLPCAKLMCEQRPQYAHEQMVWHDWLLNQLYHAMLLVISSLQRTSAHDCTSILPELAQRAKVAWTKSWNVLYFELKFAPLLRAERSFVLFNHRLASSRILHSGTTIRNNVYLRSAHTATDTSLFLSSWLYRKVN